MKSISISTKNGQFHYREYGDSSNPCLFMLHGWPETGYCWHHVAKGLEDKFRIIAPDLRGAGMSNRALDKSLYTKDKLADDNISILDKIGIDKFYLVGHDWGGAVAQEIAFKIPKRIKKLVVINMVIINNPIGRNAAFKILGTKLFNSFWYQFFQNIKELPEILIAGKEDAWVRFFMRGMTNEIPEESIQEYVKSYQQPGSITTAANLYRTMREDMLRWIGYENKAFEMPSLIIHGKLDPVIIKEYYEGIHECFKQVSLKQIDAGHFVMDEKPNEVKVVLEKFLVN